ncbi:hypothetical protein JWG43_11760 [Desulfobulbus alkaliphilus]|nr:hypothetical protein [Desulfobulbus alkaliphilus]MBM9537749.1 hypothetical protein [Desulfobulbus alkaliphilus]
MHKNRGSVPNFLPNFLQFIKIGEVFVSLIFFDRIGALDSGWARKFMVSALTMIGLHEMMARYASYADLAEIIRHRFTQPKETLKERYGRLVFIYS